MMHQHIATERGLIEYARATGELPEKGNKTQEKEAPRIYMQDRSTLSSDSFKRLIKAIQVKGWTDCKWDEAQGIWDDQFSGANGYCGDRRLNWTGTFDQYSAFFKVCIAEPIEEDHRLFYTELSRNQFFAAHFLYQNEEAPPERVGNNLRRDPTEANVKVALEIVRGLRRMLQG